MGGLGSSMNRDRAPLWAQLPSTLGIRVARWPFPASILEERSQRSPFPEQSRRGTREPLVSLSQRTGLSGPSLIYQWTQATVGKWRSRFLERRLPGLYDELRPGRPRSIEDDQVAALLKRTLSRKP